MIGPVFMSLSPDVIVLICYNTKGLATLVSICNQATFGRSEPTSS